MHQKQGNVKDYLCYMQHAKASVRQVENTPEAEMLRIVVLNLLDYIKSTIVIK